MMDETWDNEVTLILKKGNTDAIGQPVPEIEEEKIVFCKKREIGRSDRYYAGLRDIEIKELLIIHPYEYDGQLTVEFDGNLLFVESIYQINPEELELTCVGRMGETYVNQSEPIV